MADETASQPKYKPMTLIVNSTRRGQHSRASPGRMAGMGQDFEDECKEHRYDDKPPISFAAHDN